MVSGGFGQGLVIDEKTKEQDLQGPISSTFSIDYIFDGRSEWGVEHKRIWSQRSGTAVGSTGVTFKRFFWQGPPQVRFQASGPLPRGQWDLKALTPYWGLGTGISQASVFDSDVNALAFYGGGSLGFDWYLSRSWGLRAEASGNTSLGGQGRIEVVSASLGLYFNL